MIGRILAVFFAVLVIGSNAFAQFKPGKSGFRAGEKDGVTQDFVPNGYHGYVFDAGGNEIWNSIHELKYDGYQLISDITKDTEGNPVEKMEFVYTDSGQFEIEFEYINMDWVPTFRTFSPEGKSKGVFHYRNGIWRYENDDWLLLDSEWSKANTEDGLFKGHIFGSWGAEEIRGYSEMIRNGDGTGSWNWYELEDEEFVLVMEYALEFDEQGHPRTFITNLEGEYEKVEVQSWHDPEYFDYKELLFSYSDDGVVYALESRLEYCFDCEPSYRKTWEIVDGEEVLVEQNITYHSPYTGVTTGNHRLDPDPQFGGDYSDTIIATVVEEGKIVEEIKAVNDNGEEYLEWKRVYFNHVSDIQEKAHKEIGVFPNPTSNRIQWTGNATNPIIRNVLGVEQNVPCSNQQCLVKDLLPGMYVVELGRQVIPFIKE